MRTIEQWRKMPLKEKAVDVAFGIFLVTFEVGTITFAFNNSTDSPLLPVSTASRQTPSSVSK